MASSNSIQLFQFIKKFGQTIGICTPRSNRNRYALNSKNWIFAIFTAQYAMATVAFIVYDAKSVVELGIALVQLNNTIISMLVYFIINWKMDDILKFCESCERFIEKSKQNLE